MADRTCPNCGANVKRPGEARCDRCRWVTRKKIPCCWCGKPTGWAISHNASKHVFAPSHPKCRPVSHGTRKMYRDLRCRCDECRAWNNSPEHSEHVRRWQAKNLDRDRRHPIICAACGEAAMVTAKKVRYCSHDCSVLARMAQAELNRETNAASMELVHVGPMDVCHLPRLHPARRAATKRSEWWKFVVNGRCHWCQDDFTVLAASRGTAGKYCSAVCAKSAGKSAAKNRSGRFNPKPAQRKRIYDRDRWTCQLCKGSVDPDATDEWRASLDHIVPQSHQLFPDHSDAALRLVHMWCNQVRGAAIRPDEWFTEVA